MFLKIDSMLQLCFLVNFSTMAWRSHGNNNLEMVNKLKGIFTTIEINRLH